jgi:uncharacterized membrane protein YgaE (UPF0421/DUF939 family)
MIQKMYNKSFPIQTISVTTPELYKPWLTKAIENSISKKHSLYKTYQKARSPQSYTTYKNYRNKLTSILRKAEKMHYLKKLGSVRDNLTKTWKILNSLISRTSKKDSIDEIIINNTLIHDPKQITDSFNLFFLLILART